jgi:serine/threonine protein kinase
MPPLLIDEEVDDEASVSMTWCVDEDGALRHNPSGMRVSPDRGVEFGGQEYRLSPQDIEHDTGGVLGTGSQGVVQAGIHKPTGMRVAIKTVKVDNKDKRMQMLHEIRGLIQAAGCPYLVQWYAGFVAKDTGLVHVVVELMDRGSLADMRRRLGGQGVPSARIACIMAQMVRGLDHLQTRRLLHRDVKPENVLHNLAGQVKLTDFGISKDMNSTVGVAGTFVGTANYMSPERALGKDYSYRSDVWSAGMVAYELATTQFPFSTTNFMELYEALCNKPEPRLEAEHFPAELCDLVAQCLTRDETRRPDARALLSHDFLVDQGEGEMRVLGEWIATHPE